MLRKDEDGRKKKEKKDKPQRGEVRYLDDKEEIQRVSSLGSRLKIRELLHREPR